MGRVVQFCVKQPDKMRRAQLHFVGNTLKTKRLPQMIPDESDSVLNRADLFLCYGKMIALKQMTDDVVD